MPGGVRWARESGVRDLLARVAELAADHLESVGERSCRAASAGFDELRAALGGPLPGGGVAPAEQVVEELARGAAPGLVASPGPRYFGFVTGGALPAALGADWLASAWDQNSFSAVSSPAASVVEEVACGWLLDVLGLPAGLRRRADHRRADGERHRAGRRAARAARARGMGRRGAGAERLAAAARVRGRGGARDACGGRCGCSGSGARRSRSCPPTSRARCARTRCASTAPRSCARRRATSTAARSTRSPRSSPRRASTARGCTSTARSGCGRRRARRSRTSCAGAGDADSWATDGHKWLNVPYDCGVVAVRDREAHAAAMGMSAAYLVRDAGRALELRLGARGVAARARVRGLRGAALARALGRSGARRAQLRARAAAGRAGRAPEASRCSTTSCSTRCCSTRATT